MKDQQTLVLPWSECEKSYLYKFSAFVLECYAIACLEIDSSVLG
ncbi:hypothetical protein [Thalassotalea piscium]|uniref:Uncharacterized protein n=1 Tax=Thalassotalea piscium TaxID=1230533 RepID=A0A7X0NI51_9GAMM|nr:hypothetical protein [Thalassotalea piscium]MBB6543888.1 hypothetical protein [Thalassotalea piscium]